VRKTPAKFDTYEYRRSSYLRRVYGLTQEKYEELSTNQGNVCAICNEPAHLFTKGLALDHCHDTGEIRGLLCGTCNRWIVGAVKTPELLRRAADYLEKSRTGLFVTPKYVKSVRKASEVSQ